MKYFEAPVRLGDGLCSDNDCPCVNVTIPRGSGYLYISKAAVEFRRDAKSVEEAKKKIEHQMSANPVVQMAQRFGAASVTIKLPGAVLVCKQGAELRKLDLEIAEADAKYWWKTGLSPLRATPSRKSWWQFWK